MQKQHTDWSGLPHGKLEKIDENILSVVGELSEPLTKVPRRMTIVRLLDGRLILFNAIELSDKETHAIETYGKPAFLIVPGEHHRMDAMMWKARYPELVVIAPVGARSLVEQIVPVDASEVDFGDSSVTYLSVAGTDGHEAALIVRTPLGLTLVTNDLIGNMGDRSGLNGWFLRLMGYAGSGPQITAYAKGRLIEDKAALRAQLLDWSNLRSLSRIIVSHGAPIDERPAQALRELASSLAA
jgi:hypothetical protein